MSQICWEMAATCGIDLIPDHELCRDVANVSCGSNIDYAVLEMFTNLPTGRRRKIALKYR